ncbi:MULTISPECIES: hypothetical protein [unclassified Rhizobium]|uniref:hypothetical protein n=1 Tax=unclassified Rhizobium TaxID=2613769 RepID=UPI001AD96C3E|nr:MULTISPECIES: hypothetical protein [unclassified Rhizobium]MBO9100325.1 hypothetical protein [Rhizobium sp. L58/93]MBO9186218.1 hypothetical protein [Rhizobium sp. E27B/91]QXZ83137.1 hypothetical protein J5287_13790 [Rhizobium sp. K1/93]QXZ89351.1 hypothetical protein J5280_14800 [Rhizobium sp. K15/93]QYA01939.1 hypothetical protein J5278_01740 [Rhizobium sp. B21/90]
MPNTVLAAGEAMPSITTNRRRFLLGLAAASAAAAATASAPVAAIGSENPKLLDFATRLPAVAGAYHKAYDAYHEMSERRKASTPLAPDEITEIGNSNPWTEPQAGDTERYATGSYLFRQGEQWPRRIMTTSWQIETQIGRALKAKRLAKKNRVAAEFLDAEAEAQRLKSQLETVTAYEVKREHACAAALADHELLYPAREQALAAFADHVSAVMAEDDWTMEGLLIKAETLMEWSRLDKNEKIYGQILGGGADWHASIAKSILRHAQGGAS